MKYIDLSTMIDYRPYLKYLKSIEGQMPVHVFEYANNSRHWDFSDEYCPHDYWLSRISFNKFSQSPRLDIEIVFTTELNVFIFSYENVIQYTLDNVSNTSNKFRFPGSRLIIDEIDFDIKTNLISHEFALSSGSIIIKSNDFEVKWKKNDKYPLEYGHE